MKETNATATTLPSPAPEVGRKTRTKEEMEKLGNDSVDKMQADKEFTKALSTACVEPVVGVNLMMDWLIDNLTPDEMAMQLAALMKRDFMIKFQRENANMPPELQALLNLLGGKNPA